MNHSEAIAAIREQITEEQNKLANVRQEGARQQARLEDWIRTYKGPGHSPVADQAIADATRAIAFAKEQATNIEATIASLQKELQSAIKAKAQYDNNLAQAAREGLTGRAAELRAEALAQQQKIVYTGLAISGVLLVIAAVALIAWYFYLESKKKPERKNSYMHIQSIPDRENVVQQSAGRVMR